MGTTLIYPFSCNIPPRLWCNLPVRSDLRPVGHLLKKTVLVFSQSFWDVCPPPSFPVPWELKKNLIKRKKAAMQKKWGETNQFSVHFLRATYRDTGHFKKGSYFNPVLMTLPYSVTRVSHRAADSVVLSSENMCLELNFVNPWAQSFAHCLC